MENIQFDYKKEIENLFSDSKEKKKKNFGVITYESSEKACYGGDYCHFTVSLLSKDVRNLSVFSFCLGYVIDRSQIFHSFNEYQGDFKISYEDENTYLIDSDLKIVTFDQILPGSGIGSIELNQDSVQVSYKENFSDKIFHRWDYRFQMEYLESDSLFHVYDQRKRQLLETFLLEGNKRLEDIPFCDLDNKSLKKIFEGNKNGNN